MKTCPAISEEILLKIFIYIYVHNPGAAAKQKNHCLPLLSFGLTDFSREAPKRVTGNSADPDLMPQDAVSDQGLHWIKNRNFYKTLYSQTCVMQALLGTSKMVAKDRCLLNTSKFTLIFLLWDPKIVAFKDR